MLFQLVKYVPKGRKERGIIKNVLLIYIHVCMPTCSLYIMCMCVHLYVSYVCTPKYMEIGRHRGVIANEHIKICSNSYEKVKTFKYLDSLLTNQNSIQKEIK